jgi:MFS family permease
MLTPAAELATRPERCIPPWRAMLVVSFGAFLTSFDAGAITAVLPLIGRAFARGIGDVQWVLAADLLVASALLLVFGRLGDRFGSRPFYVAGFGIFFCGCIVWGMAQNLTALIAFRAFQGVGTAMLLANSPAVLVRHLSSAIRGSGFGLKASCLYLGLVAGPLAAGWMAGHFGWRSVFAVEAPAALVGFGLALGLWSFGYRASPTRLWFLPQPRCSSLP